MPSDIVKLEPKINHTLATCNRYSNTFGKWALGLLVISIILLFTGVITRGLKSDYIPKCGERYKHIKILANINLAAFIIAGICCFLAGFGAYDNTASNAYNAKKGNPSTAFAAQYDKDHIVHAKTEYKRMLYDKRLIHHSPLHSVHYTDASHDHYRQKRMYEWNIRYVREHKGNLNNFQFLDRF